MLTFIIVVIGLSFLILGHEAGHFLAAKLFKLKVEEFGFGFPPRLTAKRRGETEYSLNLLPFGGFVRIAGENPSVSEGDKSEGLVSQVDKMRLFNFQPPWKRSVIILAGVFSNFLIGWLVISLILMAGTPSILVVRGIQKNSPAAEVGIREGDVIVGFETSDEFITFVNKNRGTPVKLNLKRGGENLTVTVTPRIEVKANEGPIGVLLHQAGKPAQGFFDSLWEGAGQAMEVFALSIAGIFMILKTLILTGSVQEGIVGPVGIFPIAEQAGQIGFAYLLNLVALISINLAAINLFPFPALDGGRFALILIEKLRGAPISQKIEAGINAAGFVFLILLMLLITVRDIANL